jgi:hypothetical protein
VAGALEQPANPARATTRKHETYVLLVIVRALAFQMFVRIRRYHRAWGVTTALAPIPHSWEHRL